MILSPLTSFWILVSSSSSYNYLYMIEGKYTSFKIAHRILHLSELF